MSGAIATSGTEAMKLSLEEALQAQGDSGAATPGQQLLPVDQGAGVLASALNAIGQSGSTDQLRGYANEAIGETKLNIGLAVGSPELALLGIAQKALGQAQRYIGEAKLAAEADLPDKASLTSPVDLREGAQPL